MSAPTNDLRNWNPITYSCRDTPKTREQIVRHNTAYETIKQGKPVAVVDTCPMSAPPKEAKTS